MNTIATFDQTKFLELVKDSLSLNTFEKIRVIEQMPTLSQFQIDELTKVFGNETAEFGRLLIDGGEKEQNIVIELKNKAETNWLEVKRILGESKEDIGLVLP